MVARKSFSTTALACDWGMSLTVPQARQRSSVVPGTNSRNAPQALQGKRLPPLVLKPPARERSVEDGAEEDGVVADIRDMHGPRRGWERTWRKQRQEKGALQAHTHNAPSHSWEISEAEVAAAPSQRRRKDLQPGPPRTTRACPISTPGCRDSVCHWRYQRESA